MEHFINFFFHFEKWALGGNVMVLFEKKCYVLCIKWIEMVV